MLGQEHVQYLSELEKQSHWGDSSSLASEKYVVKLNAKRLVSCSSP